MPRLANAIFHVKIGTPLVVSRTPVGEYLIVIDTSSGLDIILGQCREALRGAEFNDRREEIKWGQSLDDVLLLKPENNTTQPKCIILTHDNYTESIYKAWLKYNSWKESNSNAEFCLRFFAYSPRNVGERNQYRAIEPEVRNDYRALQILV